MKTKINELVELQQKFKAIYEQFDTICGINNNSVHVFGFDVLKALAEQVDAEIRITKDRSFFYYKDIEFFTIY